MKQPAKHDSPELPEGLKNELLEQLAKDQARILVDESIKFGYIWNELKWKGSLSEHDHIKQIADIRGEKEQQLACWALAKSWPPLDQAIEALPPGSKEKIPKIRNQQLQQTRKSLGLI